MFLGANSARNAPMYRSLPILDPPSREAYAKALLPPPPFEVPLLTIEDAATAAPTKAPPPMRTSALEDLDFSPRSVSRSEPFTDLTAEQVSDTTPNFPGCVARISQDATPTAPLPELNERYIANLELAPTTPVHLHRSTEIFELQSEMSDVDSHASWYRNSSKELIFRFYI